MSLPSPRSRARSHRPLLVETNSNTAKFGAVSQNASPSLSALYQRRLAQSQPVSPSLLDDGGESQSLLREYDPQSSGSEADLRAPRSSGFVLQALSGARTDTPWRWRLFALLAMVLAAAALFMAVSRLGWFYRPPSLALWFVASDFPSLAALNSRDSATRQSALLTVYSVASMLKAAGNGKVLAVTQHSDACMNLRQHARLQSVECATLSSHCIDTSHRRPLLPCTLDSVKAMLRDYSLLVFVATPAILSPEFSVSVAAIAQRSQVVSASHWMLTAHSTEVVLPAQLVDSSFADYQRTVDANAVYHLLTESRRTAALKIPQTHDEPQILLYSASLFEPVQLPKLLLLPRHGHWQSFVLYTALSTADTVTIDATNHEAPLVINPLLSRSQSATEDATVNEKSNIQATPEVQLNVRLARASATRLTYRLGSIAHAAWRLRGSCPACHLQRNVHSALPQLLLARADSTSHIVVIAVHSAVLDDFLNFLCWARRIQFEHFVVFAVDAQSAQFLSSSALPVIAFDGRDGVTAVQSTRDLQGLDKLKFERWRNEMLVRMLTWKARVLLVDARTIVKESQVFARLDASTDIAALHSSQSKKSNWAAVSFAPSINAINFLHAALECQRAEQRALDTMDQATAEIQAQFGAFDCFTQAQRESSARFRYARLNPHYFLTSDEYFSSQAPHRSGYQHALVSLAQFNEDQHARQSKLELWSLNALSQQPGDHSESELNDFFQQPEAHCELLPELPTPHTDPGRPMIMRLRVLTFDRRGSLARLLDSLERVDFVHQPHPSAPSLPPVHLILVISVDAPTAATNDAAKKARESVLELSRSWCTSMMTRKWSSTSIAQFHCAVDALAQHRGLVGQWIEAWQPSEVDNEILGVLEDDLTVTPAFFTVAMHLIQRYYLGVNDAGLFSLSLQHPMTVLGETVNERYGRRDFRTRLADALDSPLPTSHSLYVRYQLVGTWGAFFFPVQWRAFRAWLTEQSFDVTTGTSAATPCVPSLIANDWWSRRTHSVWSQWMVRFAYERGLYSLYTLHPTNQSVVVNHREKGENFNETRGATNQPLLHFAQPDVDRLWSTVNSLHRLPLLDYWLTDVRESGRMSLRYRALTKPADRIDQCWTQGRKH